ncbi:MAG: hypothetical protein Q4B43_02310 [Bacteroidota bacterium]|nr:hypothetical protein [Bacteroidota bacterium]
MKTLVIAIITLLSITTDRCSNADKKMAQNMAVEYDIFTRGSFDKTILKKDSVVIIDKISDNQVQSYALSDQEWKDVIAEVKKIDRNKLKEYKAPTNNRYTDGTKAAQLRVIYQDQVYQTDQFDRGNPPSELKSLVDKVDNIYKKYKK